MRPWTLKGYSCKVPEAESHSAHWTLESASRTLQRRILLQLKRARKSTWITLKRIEATAAASQLANLCCKGFYLLLREWQTEQVCLVRKRSTLCCCWQPKQATGHHGVLFYHEELPSSAFSILSQSLSLQGLTHLHDYTRYILCCDTCILSRLSMQSELLCEESGMKDSAVIANKSFCTTQRNAAISLVWLCIPSQRYFPSSGYSCRSIVSSFYQVWCRTQASSIVKTRANRCRQAQQPSKCNSTALLSTSHCF